MTRIGSSTLFVLAFVASTQLPADDAFRSATLGFEVSKPTGWHYLTADENVENLKRTELADKELQALMLKYATAPLVAMVRHRQPFDDLNPSFKVNIRPLGQLKGAPATEVLKLIVPQFEKMLRNFSVDVAPKEVTVSGLPAGYMRVNYALRIPDGRTFPTTSELWIVPRGEYFFMIGAGTRQDEATGTRAEIESILSTVRIAR